MRSIIFNAPGKLAMREIPMRPIADDEVLVKVEACGLCTWERSVYEGLEPAEFPFIGGHEIAGKVAAVGSKVMPAIAVGQPVAVASLTRCGECYYCQRGLNNQCLQVKSKPVNDQPWGPGGFAEYMYVKRYMVHPLANITNLDTGILAEPLACVIRAIRRADLRAGDTAVVIGAGLMGLLFTLVAKYYGARVIISQPSATRRQKAIDLGADYAFDPRQENFVDFVRGHTGGYGANVVFYTAGGQQAIVDGLKALAKDGHLVVYAPIHPEAALTLDINDFHYREITLTGSLMHDHQSFVTATELISRGVVRLSSFNILRMPFTQIETAIERAKDKNIHRILLYWPDSN
ncbi:D-arabitol-phosphate dehydrogenase [Neomoorella glycerini]|uniref:D-arabitol-phosphate dehydrogenase n=1 Tax=Neomoorella glycerini TaxID=55779 RepID=A0A6I5ZMJ7_9FIRM|nr:alcohol dehydrogenase catalytic domain-containing protein [Moorella glycerini]QGP91102.1 D-arabitol-phosphate dehydrogenase [Moorella glycerini]